jgi:hypothetical protein
MYTAYHKLKTILLPVKLQFIPKRATPSEVFVFVCMLASAYNSKGIPVNTTKADNLRVLFVACYFIK